MARSNLSVGRRTTPERVARLGRLKQAGGSTTAWVQAQAPSASSPQRSHCVCRVKRDRMSFSEPRGDEDDERQDADDDERQGAEPLVVVAHRPSLSTAISPMASTPMMPHPMTEPMAMSS